MEETEHKNEEQSHWYVMRDLKRPNAKMPAYKQLGEQLFEVFTPMKWVLIQRQGKKIREEVPFMHDLIFVHATRSRLDAVVEELSTLQYRFVRGQAYRQPMTVREADMQRFMQAVRSTDSPRFYRPDEITPDMCGRKIRIVGGALDGYECHLLKVRGSRKRTILVELPNLLVAGIEVSPEYIAL